MGGSETSKDFENAMEKVSRMVENNLGIEVSKLDKKDGPFVELPIMERSKYLGARACSNFLLASKLKKDADFIVIDIHGETTSEKMALGHFFDGKVTSVVGTHTHVPTSDTQILKKGTAYQTDLGMCGDYDSVIGMNKENSIKKFQKDSSAESHYPANGQASMSGVIIDANDQTGLAENINQIILGGNLKQKI